MRRADLHWTQVKVFPEWADYHREQGQFKPCKLHSTSQFHVFHITASAHGFHWNFICINKHAIRVKHRQSLTCKQVTGHALTHHSVSTCSLCPPEMSDRLWQESSMGLELLQQESCQEYNRNEWINQWRGNQNKCPLTMLTVVGSSFPPVTMPPI